ncbi:M48 family metallopeptidase [Muricoccus radiodurans]|uniref:M48 family metallopeptidase n=1 Tax=Muricoccus radiodurans TaxID=2231721 RepID=UPI003CF680BD
MALGTKGLSTHAWNTALRSVLLLLGFPVLLGMMCFGIALIFADGYDLTDSVQRAARNLPVIVGLASVLSATWFLIAWIFHQRILDRATGGGAAAREEEPRLWRLAEELCISRGMSVPRLGIIESEALNAYASGLSRDTGAVTVTRGLMDALDDRELSAVLAHELSHIRNGDARLGVIAAIFAGILSLVADLFGRVRFSARDSRGNGPAMLLGLLLVVLSGVLAVALRFALSRQREFLADAGAVQMTRDPDAMISALRKVSGRSEMHGLPGQVQAMMLDWPEEEGWFRLHATHPRVEQRIEALVRHAGGRVAGVLPESPATVPAAAPRAATSGPVTAGGPWGAPVAAGGPWLRPSS